MAVEPGLLRVKYPEMVSVKVVVGVVGYCAAPAEGDDAMCGVSG